MAFPTKPSVTKVSWTDGDSLKQVEPSSGKKSLGWIIREKPPFEWMNWLFYSLGLWTAYFDSAIDFFAAHFYGEYDAIVGPGKDYSTLAAALSAASSGWSILVCADENINSTIVVSVPNIKIVFKPGVTFSAGSATTGIQVSVDRVFLETIRLNGFTVGINFTVAADYSQAIGCRFINCTTPVQNDSATSNEIGSMYEGSTNTKNVGVPVGTMIDFYDFNGSATFDSNYWRYCNGATLSYALSPLNGLVLPDLSGRYTVGFGTEGGADMATSSFSATPVGLIGHAFDLTHTHAVNIASFTSGDESSHTHGVGTMYAQIGRGVTDTRVLFNSSGDTGWTADSTLDGVHYNTSPLGSVAGGTELAGSTAAGSAHSHAVDPPNTTSSAAAWTSQATPSMATIQPRSVRVRKIMRVR